MVWEQITVISVVGDLLRCILRFRTWSVCMNVSKWAWEECVSSCWWIKQSMGAKSLQSGATLCDAMDCLCNPLGPSVQGIPSGKNTEVGCRAFLQRNLPHSGIEHPSLMPSALAGGFFTTSATWEAPEAVCRCPLYPDWCCWQVQTRPYQFPACSICSSLSERCWILWLW